MGILVIFIYLIEVSYGDLGLLDSSDIFFVFFVLG